MYSRGKHQSSHVQHISIADACIGGLGMSAPSKSTGKGDDPCAPSRLIVCTTTTTTTKTIPRQQLTPCSYSTSIPIRCYDYRHQFFHPVLAASKAVTEMTEPFPPLHGAMHSAHGAEGTARRRRKSSGLGADVPGDVNVPAFATHRSRTPPLKSPVGVESSVCFTTPTYIPLPPPTYRPTDIGSCD